MQKVGLQGLKNFARGHGEIQIQVTHRVVKPTSQEQSVVRVKGCDPELRLPRLVCSVPIYLRGQVQDKYLGKV